MERLTLIYNWGGEPCGGTIYIPFEYKSKIHFIYDMLEKYKNHEWKYYGTSRNDWETSTVEIFKDVYFTKADIDDIENKVLTIDEWFLQNKESIL